VVNITGKTRHSDDITSVVKILYIYPVRYFTLDIVIKNQYSTFYCKHSFSFNPSSLNIGGS
jgi:hypothetical protein